MIQNIECLALRIWIDFVKDEKEEDFVFSFDRVFYEKSEQADVYEFLALPIVRGIHVNSMQRFNSPLLSVAFHYIGYSKFI